MPHPQPITGSIHHHCLPSREKRSALSGEVATRGPRSLRPAPAWGGCLLSPRSCRCVRTGKAGGGSAPYLPAGEGCAPRPRPRPHPWAGGPGTPRRVPSPGPRARASALTANRGVECGPRVGGRTHIPGVSALRLSGGHGEGSDALRSPCGPEPGRSFVFRGTQPQTRTPREGRGGAGAGASRGGETRGVGGAQGWRPRSRSPYPASAPFVRAQRPF